MRKSHKVLKFKLRPRSNRHGIATQIQRRAARQHKEI